jgi:hypothetical protein
MCAAKFCPKFSNTTFNTKEFTDPQSTYYLFTLFRLLFEIAEDDWGFLKILWILKEVLVWRKLELILLSIICPQKSLYAREGAPLGYILCPRCRMRHRGATSLLVH